MISREELKQKLIERLGRVPAEDWSKSHAPSGSYHTRLGGFNVELSACIRNSPTLSSYTIKISERSRDILVVQADEEFYQSINVRVSEWEKNSLQRLEQMLTDGTQPAQ